MMTGHACRMQDRSAGRYTAWRHRKLVAAGFDECLARRLAEEPSTDLHTMLELVDRGCPPPVAARICAPLDLRQEP